MKVSKSIGGWTLVLLILSCRLSTAQEMTLLERLSLDEAIAIALANHPRVERSRLETESAEQGVRAAKSGYYPWVAVEGIAKDGLSGAAGGLGLEGLPGSPFFDKLAIAVNVRVTAYDFGRTGNRVEEARITAASLRSNEEAERAGVVWNVKTAYYRSLQAEELLRVAEETLEERKLTARQANVYYEAELRSKVDANLSEVSVMDAEAELIRARNSRHLSFAALNRVMGIRGRTDYQLQAIALDGGADETLEDLINKALVHRPDLQSLNLEARAAEASLDAARSERMPWVSAVASVGKARFREDFDGENWLVGVGFTVPLFTGFALESQIHQTEAKLRAAEATQRELVNRIRYEVQQAYFALETSESVAEVTRAQVTLAEESLRLATQRYAAQLGSFLDLTQAEVALVRSKQKRAQAVYDVLIAEATLDYVLGASVDEGEPEVVARKTEASGQ